MTCSSYLVFQSCVSLWNYALDLKVNKETLLSCDTSFTARAIVQLYVNIMMRDDLHKDIDFQDVLDTARHVNQGKKIDILTMFKKI